MVPYKLIQIFCCTVTLCCTFTVYDSNILQYTLAQVAFRRCGMTVIHEPHNLGSTPSDRPDLFAPSTDTAYDITVLSAYASANVAASAKAPVLQYFAAKPKSISDTTRA